MSTMASQITSLTIVYPTVYLGVDKRKQRKWKKILYQSLKRSIPKMFQVVSYAMPDLSSKFCENPFIHLLSYEIKEKNLYSRG